MSESEQRFRQADAPAPYTPMQLAYDAFLIEQQAARHSPETCKWYVARLRRLMAFLAAREIHAPEEIQPGDCHAFIVELQRCGLKDTTVHGYAQVAIGYPVSPSSAKACALATEWLLSLDRAHAERESRSSSRCRDCTRCFQACRARVAPITP